MNFLASTVLPLYTAAELRAAQGQERRCIRIHAAAGIPVDELCATWVDRHQDEIDRQDAGMPLPQVVADLMIARYGRTGPEAAS